MSTAPAEEIRWSRKAEAFRTKSWTDTSTTATFPGQFQKHDDIVFVRYMPINFLPILPNAFIIFLCFKNPVELKEQTHSKYLIGHTAFLDLAFTACNFICYLMSWTFHSYHIEITALHCTSWYILSYSLSGGVVLSYLSTTLCRFRHVILN